MGILENMTIWEWPFVTSLFPGFYIRGTIGKGLREVTERARRGRD